MKIYYINLEDAEGMLAISLVADPAVQKNFLCFSEDKPIKLQLANEAEHKVTGVVCEESIDLPALTAKGYSLVGWYDNAEFNGSPITSYSAETDGEEVCFYAKWEKAYYGVVVKSTVEGYVTPETVSISEDGLTITFDGTPAYISFQIYNGGEIFLIGKVNIKFLFF